jgi:hypothetical protein
VGWCTVLNKYVPTIVLLQNRLALRNYIQEHQDANSSNLQEEMELLLTESEDKSMPEEVQKES